MATVFAIFEKEPETDHHGMLIESDFLIGHTEIAYRGSGGIYFKESLLPIIVHLSGNVPVYPLDNGPQGIFCINDIRKELDPDLDKWNI